jgi:hypothetical protein
MHRIEYLSSGNATSGNLNIDQAGTFSGQIDHREEALMLDLSAPSVLHLARSEHNRRRFRLRPQARAR